MVKHARRYLVVGSAVLATLVAACGGGSDGLAAIGGTVTGLTNGRTIVLQNNKADTVSYVGNGATSFTFAFPTGIGSGEAYSATVQTQPLGQTCLVTNGTGNVNSSASPVTTILINCGTTSSVVGSVSGLAAGVFVRLSAGTTNVSVTDNGSFFFPEVLTAGSTYTVTVANQPAGQTCTVTNPTGTVVANASASVNVVCVNNPA